MEPQTNSNTPMTGIDSEKRLRREIANSNERRRMQSINIGYQLLKSLLPHHKGEKLSKAGILQQTSDYVQLLEKERTQLLIQNTQLRQKLKDVSPQLLEGISPPPKRKKRDTESSDEGIGLGFDIEPAMDILELKRQLDRERQQRIYLETRIHNLEAQMDSSDKSSPVIIKQIVSAVPASAPASAVQAHHVPAAVAASTVPHSPGATRSITANQLSSSLSAQLENNRMEMDEVESSSKPIMIKPDKELPTSVNIKSNSAGTVSYHGATKSAPIDVPLNANQRKPINNPQHSPEFTSPQSKRNLEIIAEAIRHLEGETFGSVESKFKDSNFNSVSENQMSNVNFVQNNNTNFRHFVKAELQSGGDSHCVASSRDIKFLNKQDSGSPNPNHSEESQTESCNSDQEDYHPLGGKYGGDCSSGSESPLSSSAPDSSSSAAVNSKLIRAAATLCVTSVPPNQHRGLVGTPVQLPMSTQGMQIIAANAGYFPPGIIVHKSS